MNAELLLTGLSQAGDAPERIQQLRKIAVALAISGRLDTPDATMSPDEMLEAVGRIRDALVQQGARPKQKKNLSGMGEDRLPEGFADPARFVSLGALARVEKGQTGIQQAVAGPFPLVVTAAERSSCDHYDFNGAAAIIPLVSSTGHGKASINRLHYQDGYFALGTILAAVFPFDPGLMSARFLFEYLSAFKDELLVSRMTGTANVTLTIGAIEDVPVPLVGPDVQAKVDELMVLCDDLEAAWTAREGARDRLVAASLARLSTAEHEAFQADICFALEALPALTARPDQINQFRKTVLNLAVQGKLVPQDPTEGSASQLLATLAAERSRQVAAGAVPRPKSCMRDPERSSQQVPDGWKLIALGDACTLVTSGSRGWGEYYSKEGAMFIRAQNIRFGKLRLEDLACVKPPLNSEGSRTQVAKGDLLVVITGAGVTNPALLNVDLGEAYVSQHVGLIRPTDHRLSRWFLICLMADAGGGGELTERAYGAGKPGLNLDNLRSLTVPLPPLAEQHRIVAKVDELMDLCDRLEASLTTSDATRRRLLDALLANALTRESFSTREIA